MIQRFFAGFGLSMNRPALEALFAKGTRIPSIAEDVETVTKTDALRLAALDRCLLVLASVAMKL